MDLVLFGIQGSGKGTQAKRLAAEFGYVIFEAGSALRDMIATGSELGKTISSYIDTGNLAPYNIVIDVAEDFIRKTPADQPILFDGIPRDDDQKKEFDRVMRESNRPFRCIQLDIPHDVAVHRLQTRARELGRLDDSHIEYIERRLRIFREKTLPVIESYKADGNMTVVDSNATPDEVDKRLTAVLR
jgi:adenylate kinase